MRYNPDILHDEDDSYNVPCESFIKPDLINEIINYSDYF